MFRVSGFRGVRSALAVATACVGGICALLGPKVALAVVFFGNPGKLEVILPGAEDGDVHIESLTFAPCSGSSTPETQTDLYGDLVDGFDYASSLSSICGMAMSLEGGELIISGTNAWGEFEIAVDESELVFDGEDLPKTLAYTVISGTVASGPVLDVSEPS